MGKRCCTIQNRGNEKITVDIWGPKPEMLNPFAWGLHGSWGIAPGQEHVEWELQRNIVVHCPDGARLDFKWSEVCGNDYMIDVANDRCGPWTISKRQTTFFYHPAAPSLTY